MNEVSSEWGAIAEAVCYCLAGTALLFSIFFFTLCTKQDVSVHQTIDEEEPEDEMLNGQEIALYVIGTLCAVASVSFFVAAWLIRLVA